MAEEKRVRMRSLQIDNGEGSYGFEHFKIKDGAFTVNESTAEAMVSQQPFQWARADESDKDVQARLRGSREAQEEINHQQRVALGIIREPVAHGDSVEAVAANRAASIEEHKESMKLTEKAHAAAEGGNH